MDPVCKYHPDREAKRKCHNCRRFICTDCQLKIERHIYCSKKCYYIERLKNLYDKTKLSIQASITFLRENNILTIRNVVEFILVIGLIISIKIGINNHRTVKLLEQKQVIQELETSWEQLPVDSIAAKIDTLSIFTPPAKAMVIKNIFDVEGETEENRVVSLSANGKLIAATVAKGRKFSFKKIKASPGQNHFVVRSMDEFGSSILLEEIKFFYGTPTYETLARDFVRGSIEENKIALTFDGGYLDNAASEILDILKQENIKATLFLTGIFIRKYPDLVKQMVAEGHTIGNHTWTHPHLTSFAQDRKHNTLNNVKQELVQEELLRTSYSNPCVISR
jgi:hypothetical protein